MMIDHIKALGIKFIYISIIIFSLFGIFYNVSVGKMFLMSVLVSGISYVLGDLMLYPRVGNLIASILDFGLAFLSIVTLGGLLISTTMPTTLASLAAAFFIMCIEPLFHAYMTERVFNPTKDFVKDPNDLLNIIQVHPQLQTEFAEETDSETMKEKSEQMNNREEENTLNE